MNRFLILISVTIFFSCTDLSEERPSEWHGEWEAKWETPPESYPELSDMEFTMNGQFTFTEDSLTVNAMGYEGCIFNSDTISHTQSWKISSDTLFLINDPDLPGITYKINSKSTDRIELQLMEDIFVTLSK